MMLAAGLPVSAAADAQAGFVTKLFIDACVPNMSQPTKIRAWAEDHHLNQISSTAALDVFVGSGDRGAAWAVPAASGNYALFRSRYDNGLCGMGTGRRPGSR